MNKIRLPGPCSIDGCDAPGVCTVGVIRYCWPHAKVAAGWIENKQQEKRDGKLPST